MLQPWIAGEPAVDGWCTSRKALGRLEISCWPCSWAVT